MKKLYLLLFIIISILSSFNKIQAYGGAVVGGDEYYCPYDNQTLTDDGHCKCNSGYVMGNNGECHLGNQININNSPVYNSTGLTSCGILISCPKNQNIIDFNIKTINNQISKLHSEINYCSELQISSQHGIGIGGFPPNYCYSANSDIELCQSMLNLENVCSQALIQTIPAVSKVTCSANSTQQSDGSCVCNNGYVKIIPGQTYQCITISSWCTNTYGENIHSVGKTDCACNNGYYFDGSSKSCKFRDDSKCIAIFGHNSEALQVAGESGPICRCSDGYDMVEKKCTPSNVNTKCQSDFGINSIASLTKPGYCSCTEGYQFSGSGNEKSCIFKTEPAKTIAPTVKNTPVINTLIKFTRTLKYNTKGDDVKLLQNSLVKLGYLPVTYKVTDTFNKTTRNAVIKFQKDNNIKPTKGLFDSGTQKVLIEKL